MLVKEYNGRIPLVDIGGSLGSGHATPRHATFSSLLNVESVQKVRSTDSFASVLDHG